MVLFSASKVTERHLLLRENIGTFAKEDDAYDLLNKLRWLLPTLVISFAVVDLFLAVVYLKWLHPWRVILQEVRLKYFFLVFVATMNNFFRSRIAGNVKP